VFGYEYDFGNSWEHDIVFEGIVTGVDVADAVFLEGERSCPPEDVGGPSGYIRTIWKLYGILPIRTTARWWNGGDPRSTPRGLTWQGSTVGCINCPGVDGGEWCRDRGANVLHREDRDARLRDRFLRHQPTG